MKILFVCLGNICRSPLAEAIAREIASKKNLQITVDSAGTGNWHEGEAPCSNSIKVAKLHGIDISNLRARQVTKKDFKEFDMIIGLDGSNIQNLKNMGCKNPYLLGDFGCNGEDVPDPYYFSELDGFHKVYEMIELCVENLINKIKVENAKVD